MSVGECMIVTGRDHILCFKLTSCAENILQKKILINTTQFNSFRCQQFLIFFQLLVTCVTRFSVYSHQL